MLSVVLHGAGIYNTFLSTVIEEPDKYNYFSINAQLLGLNIITAVESTIRIALATASVSGRTGI